MPASKTSTQILAELRSCAAPRLRRPARTPEVALLIARLVSQCKTLAAEERVNGHAFHLHGSADSATEFSITCVLHRPAEARVLTSAEQSVAELLCEGRTLAQIAKARGVSTNTVKSQVRQVFRKLNV